ncbi:hypothetical protein JTB14_019984 [Gonioctena quinquepunctata]|nr:hypothetical protein JTB14_019984 [Gonioctena quinquepunctata]
MANLRKATFAVLVFMTIPGAFPAAILDLTDECILVCDYCYKNEILLNCANDCLFTSGKIQQRWRENCPFFGSYEPSVNVL